MFGMWCEILFSCCWFFFFFLFILRYKCTHFGLYVTFCVCTRVHDFLKLMRLLFHLCSVKRVFVSSQLWYLPRRPVHRHRLWRQKGYSLWSHLLNSDWLKKKKKDNLQIKSGVEAKASSCTNGCTCVCVGGIENERHSTPTLFFCLRLWKKWERKRSKGAQSRISGKKETVFNALRMLVSI